ncbi:isopeptide-forming domain-containing fimbrial protein [Butyrivibrio sp. XPD2006]|uniref:isopeptide-forming domain-containing fimbrial protein n=1 Tax=Butyrivibrio sp. XPD2006 TaxID=1280668 RepID=UPI0003B51465|nr:isopeptide-forming domain-containing fimbrial protein [Butyrivibrio sp. XPD2006]
MKGIKKLLTGILAATMIMGASLTAFAAEDTVSITIENELKEGADGVKTIDYTYYQFLKAEVISLDQNGASQSGSAVYYVESEALAEALQNTGVFKYTKAASNTERYYIEATTQDAQAIVNALNTDDMKPLAISTGTFSSGADRTATASGLEPGYYLVLSSLGTKAALQTLEDVTIKEKNEDTTVTKDDNIDVDAMFDKEVEYTITIKVPESPAEKDIEVVDTATAGLTLDKNVLVNGEAYDWSVWSDGVATTKDNKAAFEYKLTIPKDTVVANAGENIVLTYKAEVNKNAVVYVPEQNTAYIVYDNNKSAETVPVTVKTLGIKIIKYTMNGNEEKRLTGAEFTLWDALEGGNQIALVQETLADGKVGYRPAKAGETAATSIVVDENGEAFVAGLDDDANYYLQEEVAPAGYTMLDERFEVVMDRDLTEYQPVKILNNTGLVLPSTGGIGTTIFYIVGGVLIVAGIAYFIVRRKANAQ